MNNFQNNTVSTISYKVIERMIVKFQQISKETTHLISLSDEKITTGNHTFQLVNVFDISYKPFSGHKGLLYLHTIQGMVMFEIDSDPSLFIETYKKLRIKLVVP